VVGVQVCSQGRCTVFQAGVERSNLPQVAGNLIPLFPGGCQLLVITGGDGAVDLVFDQLKQAAVDGRELQGRVKLVPDFTEALGVPALRDDGEGLTDHKGGNGDDDQHCQLVRYLQ